MHLAALMALGLWASATVADAPVPLTLADAIARAERDNPELAALRAGQEGQEARAAAAGRASWPGLSLSVDAFRTDDPVRVFAAKLGRGEFAQEDFAIDRLNDPGALFHVQSALRVQVPVDVFGAVRSGSRAAAANARASAADVAEAVQELRARVVQAYRQSVLAAAAVDVTAQALEGARAREAELQARVETGAALTADLLRARARRRQREADLAQRQDERAAALAVLARLMGAPPGTALRLTEAVPAPVPDAQAEDLDAWTARALRARAGTRAASERAHAAEAARQAEDRGGLPALAVYGQVQDDRGSPGAAGGQWLTLGAALRWNLLDAARGRRKAAARADQLAAETAVRAAQDQVRLEVALAWHRARTARERRLAAAGGAEEAREALRVVRERRQAGMATLTDELDTESALLAAELEELRASTEAALAESALRRAAGEL